MTQPCQTHHLHWRGMRIEVRYCPSWLEAHEEIVGQPLAHLEIDVLDPLRSPLPITATGYRSHFTAPQVIDAEGGAVAFVNRWLDEAAQSPDWKAQEAAARQMSFL